MVLAVINILGRRFRLVLLPEEGSLPPPTVTTTGVEVSGPVTCKPVLRLVRGSSEAA